MQAGFVFKTNTISRILSLETRRLLFISFLYCYKTLAAYPSALDEQPLSADILGVAPHRVYLISLQPNCTCFLLHLSYSREWRVLPAMLLYGVRTFLFHKRNQQAIFVFIFNLLYFIYSLYTKRNILHNFCLFAVFQTL